jgi:hypothetical protein
VSALSGLCFQPLCLMFPQIVPLALVKWTTSELDQSNIEDESPEKEFFPLPLGREKWSAKPNETYDACLLGSSYCCCKILDAYESKKIVNPGEAGIENPADWSETALSDYDTQKGRGMTERLYSTYFAGVVPVQPKVKEVIFLFYCYYLFYWVMLLWAIASGPFPLTFAFGHQEVQSSLLNFYSCQFVLEKYFCKHYPDRLLYNRVYSVFPNHPGKIRTRESFGPEDHCDRSTFSISCRDAHVCRRVQSIYIY